MSSIVLVRFGAFGDTLMLTPVFRYLSQQFGVRVDYAGRSPWAAALMAGVPEVDAVREIASKRTPYIVNRPQQALVRWLHARADATFLDLEGDAKSASLLRRAGIPENRILRFRGMPVDPRYRHQVQSMLARVRTRIEGRGDIDDLDASLSVSVTEAWRRDLDAWLTRRGWQDDDIIVLAPGNKRSMSWRPYGRSSNRKHWPVRDWGILCDAIHERNPGARVLVVGAPSEQRLAESVADAAVSGRVHAVARDMSITRLVTLLARARGAVALDSGPAHAAAAVGCPVVCLFKATEPGRFRPLSRHGTVRVVTPGGVPLEAWRPGPISMDQVLSAWNELMGESLTHGEPSDTVPAPFATPI